MIIPLGRGAAGNLNLYGLQEERERSNQNSHLLGGAKDPLYFRATTSYYYKPF